MARRSRPCRHDLQMYIQMSRPRQEQQEQLQDRVHDRDSAGASHSIRSKVVRADHPPRSGGSSAAASDSDSFSRIQRPITASNSANSISPSPGPKATWGQTSQDSRLNPSFETRAFGNDQRRSERRSERVNRFGNDSRPGFVTTSAQRFSAARAGLS